MNTTNVSASRPLYRLSQLIWYVFYIIEIILLFRFLLELLGANPAASFTQFVYAISYPLVRPFIYVFPPAQITGATIDWATVLGVFVYWIIATVLVKLLALSRPISSVEAHQKLQDEEDSTDDL